MPLGARVDLLDCRRLWEGRCTSRFSTAGLGGCRSECQRVASLAMQSSDSDHGRDKAGVAADDEENYRYVEYDDGYVEVSF